MQIYLQFAEREYLRRSQSYEYFTRKTWFAAFCSRRLDSVILHHG